MTSITVTRRSHLPVPPADVWAWHCRPGAFERLVPPWEGVEVLARDPRGIVDGAEVTLRVRLGPIPMTWVARHEVPVPGRGFVDTQVRGPLAAFRHERRFEPDGEDGCWLTDEIMAVPPFGPLGHLAGPHLRATFDRMLRWRHQILLDDLAVPPAPPMRIALTGATGLVATALAPMLTTAGHTVVPVSRRPLPGGIQWAPGRGHLDPEPFEGCDAVIHLAGASIAGGRWSGERKRLLRESRIGPTLLLSRTLAALDRPPRVLLSASAIGVYGDGGDRLVDESSELGTDFLGALGAEWEAAADPARQAGIRVVHPRFGLILSSAGGVLDRMLTPFRLGVGGRLGDGQQWMSWVAIDDVLGSCRLALEDPRIEGPVNVVAPEPVRNVEFTETLARVLRRPAILPVPASVLRTIFGQMADALLLSGQRVEPRVLADLGYRFRQPSLEDALRHLLGR